jgi:hypothetical protein
MTAEASLSPVERGAKRGDVVESHLPLTFVIMNGLLFPDEDFDVRSGYSIGNDRIDSASR